MMTDEVEAYIGSCDIAELTRISKIVADRLCEETDSSIINDTKLYIDYVETVAQRLETTYNNASKLVDEDIIEEVLNDMYQAETDHIANKLPHYERLLNVTK